VASLRRQIKGVALIVGMLIMLSTGALQSGCGSSAQGTVRKLGNTTTKEDVMKALERTGYKFQFRKVPHLEEYEVVSGEAIHGYDRIEFTVEIRLDGPFEDIKKSSEGNPQPPVLRYQGMGGSEVIGNTTFATEAVKPMHAGKGIELEPDPAQTEMEVNVDVALRKLFAEKYRPVG
jgi:hypothetical protein